MIIINIFHWWHDGRAGRKWWQKHGRADWIQNEWYETQCTSTMNKNKARRRKWFVWKQQDNWVLNNRREGAEYINGVEWSYATFLLSTLQTGCRGAPEKYPYEEKTWRWFFGEIVKTWLTNLRRPGGLSSILLARRFSSKKNRLSWKIGSILTDDLKLFCLCYVFLSKVCLLTIFQLCLWKNQTNWLQVEDLAEFQKKSWLSPTKSFTKKRNLNKNYEITSFFLEIVIALAHNVKLRPVFFCKLESGNLVTGWVFAQLFKKVFFASR